MIICMWNKGHTWNFTNQRDMHNFSSLQFAWERKIEGTEASYSKPVKLLEHIIKIASNKNDVVLDPFMGVASTGTALNLNRMFAGVKLRNLLQGFYKKNRRTSK